MNHSIDIYIIKRLDELKWIDKVLVEKSGLSKSQISKLKKGKIGRLTAATFYKIYNGFGDSCGYATKIVFGNIKLKTTKPEKRTPFGRFMLQFEKSENTIAEISTKTGIEEIRLKEIYFKNGALEAHELLLIEKAIGEEQGELFEKFYKDKSNLAEPNGDE